MSKKLKVISLSTGSLSSDSLKTSGPKEVFRIRDNVLLSREYLVLKNGLSGVINKNNLIKNLSENGYTYVPASLSDISSMEEVGDDDSSEDNLLLDIIKKNVSGINEVKIIPFQDMNLGT